MPMQDPRPAFFYGFGHGGPGPLGILLFIVFWAGVALLVLTLLQRYRRGPRPLHDHWHGHGVAAPHNVATNPALDILRERFAKREVNEEEFTRRLALLKDS